MSDAHPETDTDDAPTDDHPDRTAIRKTVRQVVDAATDPTRDDVEAAVAAACATGPETVSDELDTLERHGFIYHVPREDGVRVVKLP